MEFATGALGTLLPKLSQLLQDEYNLQKGVKKNIEFLKRELESMHAALSNISEVPVEKLSELVRIWARDVREVSYDMEDIVDTFLVRVHGPEPPSKRSAKRFIKKMMDIFTKAPTRHKIGQEIKVIKERIEEMAARRDRYKVDDFAASQTLVDPDPRITALYAKTADLVGIDEAKKELITLLTKGDDMSSHMQRIVSIVGFGGLGKTTLAKAVHDEIKAVFDCTAFVSVSRNPDIKKLLKNMLYELDKGVYGDIHSRLLEETHLINLVREFLQNKRYLIVIDDIWDTESWRIIRCALVENNMTSGIITTTRIIGIAEQLGYCYRLNPLTHESSKTLFYGRIFGSQDKCPKQYYEVSEKILKKCGGVPLAIITTSSLLANKLGNMEVWYRWCDYIGSGLGRNHDIDNMRRILSFSYYDLPSHLKTCLLYLSTFPEDYNIRRERLIWRWIAEGFVQYGEGSRQNLYEIGLSYFIELLNRSLIQPSYYIEDDVMLPIFCCVHDMVLDLICSLSREDGFVTTVLGDCRQSSSSREHKVRRLSIHSATCPTMNMSKLRSLTISNSAILKSIPPFSSYHLLRVFDLHGCNLKGHPSLEFLGNLFHLRFISLFRTGYDGEVPEVIGRLRFLQFLDFGETDIKQLPSSIVVLRQLMCLGVGESTRLPNRLRNLTSLHALVARNVDSAYIAEEIGQLTQLRRLIVELRKDKDGVWDENMCKALVGSLGKLHRIQFIDVRSIGVAADLEGSVESSLGDLHRLIIRNTILIPAWINPISLIALSYLEIKVGNLRREDIQVLGFLPALRFLKVRVTGMRVQAGEDFMVRPDAFPCLRTCIFYGFSAVPSMFPPGAMPRLEYLAFDITLGDDSCGGESIVEGMTLGHLPSLHTVWIGLTENDNVTKEVEMKLREKLKLEVEVHPRHPRLFWRHFSASPTTPSACTYSSSSFFCFFSWSINLLHAA